MSLNTSEGLKSPTQRMSLAYDEVNHGGEKKVKTLSPATETAEDFSW